MVDFVAAIGAIVLNIIGVAIFFGALVAAWRAKYGGIAYESQLGVWGLLGVLILLSIAVGLMAVARWIAPFY